MLLRAILFVVLLVVCAAPKISAAQKPSPPAPSMKPLHPQWPKIHKAGLIVLGTLATRAEGAASYKEPFLLELRSVQALKGTLPQNRKEGGTVRVRYFLPYAQNPAVLEKELRYIQDLSDKPVLVFAESAKGLNGLENTIQVLSTRDASIVPAKLSDAKNVRAEVENQAAIKAWFPTSPLAKSKPGDLWESTVTKGIDRLVRDAQIDKAADTPADDAQKRLQTRVEDIEKWGSKSYPALIRHLTDLRKLPGLMVGYKTPPGFWESRYYERPETVMNVVDSVLTFSTRADLSPLDLRGGGTDAQRLAVTQAWWVYMVYSYDTASAGSH